MSSLDLSSWFGRHAPCALARAARRLVGFCVTCALLACAPATDLSTQETQTDNALADDADASVAEPIGPITNDSISNEAIVDLLQNRKYRGPGFRALNVVPFPSTVSPQKKIALYVSDAGYDALSQVASDEAGSGVNLPVGTVIVRDVLNAGVLDTITVMVKLAPGAFPLGGDWWYAAADPDGKIRMDAELQTPLAGLLQNCGTCHLRRSQDDFLFGAPSAYLP